MPEARSRLVQVTDAAGLEHDGTEVRTSRRSMTAGAGCALLFLASVFEEMGGAVLADKARSMLYANPGSANAWLSLELEGVRSNRRAMGARIKVVLGAGSETRAIYRTVGSGGSFGASPLRQEIGLGSATAITRVEIEWPATGETQTIEGLQPRHRYHVREGEARATQVGTAAQ